VPHPSEPGRADAFWIVGGRVADWGPVPADPSELASRTAAALRAGAGGGWLPAGELDEARIVGAWLAGHQARVLELEPAPSPARLEAFVAAARRAPEAVAA
jgi:hypothetical protein